MTGPINAMSVDVEDYFHVSAFETLVSRDSWDSRESRVESNTLRLLDLLDQTRSRATFFVLGWVAARHPQLVRRIAERGHELASHSFEHRLVYSLTPDAFRDDLRRAREAIQSAAGVEVVGFRAPSYSVTAESLWALDVLMEEGYRYDASIFPIHHDRYGLPRAPRHPFQVERQGRRIWEVPSSTVRGGRVNLPIAGGGYFRLLPYAWTRWGIGRVNRAEGRPVVFYVHPWEIDAAQPRLPASRTTRWRHYGNLRRTEARLSRLLGEFRFDTVASVLDRLEGIAARAA